MAKKVDLRIVKTKKNIYEALVRLLERKSFEEIKVSEICDEAMINRSTFYSHFDDKYILIDTMINDLKDELMVELNKLGEFDNLKEYYLAAIRIFLEHIESEKSIYAAMMTYNRNSVIMDIAYKTLVDNVKEHISENNDTDIPPEFVTAFYIGAIVNIGTEWLVSKEKYSIDDIISYFDKLFI